MVRADDGPRAPTPSRVEVRLALSDEASKLLSEPRVRRLLEIELADNATVAPGVGGPLGDHLAYVWVDVPSAKAAVVEVRVGDRPVARREIGVAGMRPDVTARLVTIGAAELVRREMQPLPAKRAPIPTGPSPEELERARRLDAAFQAAASAMVVLLPAQDGVLAGPGVTVGFRYHAFQEALFARWLSGNAAGTTVRWLEAGVALDHRTWLAGSLRVTLGATAAAASVHLPGALSVDGLGLQHDTWSARAGALAGIEARLPGPLWAGLFAEPGVILRSAPFEDASGAARSVGGAFLGFALTLAAEPASASR